MKDSSCLFIYSVNVSGIASLPGQGLQLAGRVQWHPQRGQLRSLDSGDGSLEACWLSLSVLVGLVRAPLLVPESVLVWTTTYVISQEVTKILGLCKAQIQSLKNNRESSAHAARATERPRAAPRSCVCPFRMCLFSFPVPWESSAVLTWARAPPEAGLCCGGCPCVPGVWHRIGLWMHRVNTC